MISIVVDTNILRSSPFLSRQEWASLSANQDSWQIRLMIPEVVLMETTNVVTREWKEQQTTFTRAKVADMGLQADVNALIQSVEEQIIGYGANLTSKLSDLGAEVVPTPAVPHLEVAKRASEGIAPYHGGKKDGYRDTLIWLSVLDIATKNPTHQIWFVSNNSQDFGGAAAKDKAPGSSDESDTIERQFHPQLREELEVLGLQDRVKYITSLKSLEQHLAALHAPITAEVLQELTDSVDWEELRVFFELEKPSQISAMDAALSPTAAFAAIDKFHTGELAWKFSDASGNGENRWTANYVVDVEADIQPYSSDFFPTSTRVTKPLRVTGTATFTKSGGVQEFEIARVEALPDDPDRELWEVLQATGFEPWDIFDAQNTTAPSDTIMKFLASQSAPSDTIMKFLASQSAPSDTIMKFLASRNMTPPADPSTDLSNEEDDPDGESSQEA